MDPMLKYDLEDPCSLWLDPTRHERVNIPAGPPPEQKPIERILFLDGMPVVSEENFICFPSRLDEKVSLSID